MNKYELMYILDATLEGEPRKELIDRFTKLLTDNGATVDKVDEWGKRRLAYPIDFKNEGYYVLVSFQAEAQVPREIERNLQINEMVVRSMIVKLEEKRSSVKPRPVVVRPMPIPAASSAPIDPPAPAEAVESVEPAPIAAAPVEAAAPSEPAPAAVDA